MDGAPISTAGTGRTALREAALSDRFDLSKTPVLLSGVQALLRLSLMQQARDAAQGWKTAGYITGYRGSPLGGVDLAAWRAKKELEAAGIVFEPGLNEDLAATAIWGTQQAHLRGRGLQDGVFGMWYGKGPGVDRSGDAFRHANLAGTAPLGGVLVAMGDDHTCESSTTCHQSDVALMDAQMPVLHPAGPQEILDFGLIGWGLSRFTGCWVGVKCVKDTVESTTVVDGALDRVRLVLPSVPMPPQGLNIILGETPQEQEARLIDWRLPAVVPYARANGLDRRGIGKPGARIGVAASGKSWLDVVQALGLLGIDGAEAERLGVSGYKIGLAWPLDAEGIAEFAQGLELMMVVEEKRAFIETQAKEALYARPDRPQILGKRDADGRPLFSAKMDLGPMEVAVALGEEILKRSPNETRIAERVSRLKAAQAVGAAPSVAERTPYFCSGCPHNSSTVVPEGSRAGAGIGCHYMAQWMDRETSGYTHMGAEGANWVGESKFVKDGHIFQNLGDGTYNHSGVMAIRAAVASGANITYKLLYNDAVAMTGGQTHDGGLPPEKIVREILAAGAKRVEVVVDPKEEIDANRFPRGVTVSLRDELDTVQKRLRDIKGVTALVYIQTCAAEKRRRRKRGRFPDPDARVMINELVCEGCGDCGAQSNCVSILPLETEFGRKRQIDQSSCNKDFSCLKGFCPSFVTVTGAVPKKPAPAALEVGSLPEPAVPAAGGDGGPFNLVITGVGGTGVVTVGALLGMAAHLEGKGVGVMEMAGLAQKGGAVRIHVRIAPTPEDIAAVRVAPGEADALIGGDLVVSGGAKTLSLADPARTGAVVNAHEIITGDFTRNTEFSLPTRRLKKALEQGVAADRLRLFDATKLAERFLGDAIYANVLLLGAAWQAGLVPLSEASLKRAIELNGAGVAGNLRAFEIGRWAVAEPEKAAQALVARRESNETETLDALIAKRADWLEAYQDRAWADRYRDAIDAIVSVERAVAPGSDALSFAAARSLFKLMSYKDEYEVARLHTEATKTMAADRFETAKGGRIGFKLHLAPPLLARKGADGRPKKMQVGGWILPALAMLRRGKVLRGGVLDPFGWTAERRMERALIAQFETDLREIARKLDTARLGLAVEIALLPQSIRGFGSVKSANAAAAASRRAGLIARFRAGDVDPGQPAAAPIAAE